MVHATDNSQQPPRRNIKLVIAYNGAAYHGWQRQRVGVDTVQLQVERAARMVMSHPVTVLGASRTDAGVHAEGQVANFFTTNLSIPTKNIRRAVTSKLPRDIDIRSAEEVGKYFNSSRAAVGKTYRYRVSIGAERPVFQATQTFHFPFKPLDIAAMREASKRLLGWHDFRGFASSAEIRENTVRHIWRCDVSEIGREIHITVEGNGFLYHMVRNIAGTLIEVGRDLWGPGRIDHILARCDRHLAGPTAPAGGLSLVAVHYK